MTYNVTRTVYYGPERTMYRGRILEGVSLDEARDCVTRWCDWDLCFLNGRHGDGAYTNMPLWPARKHCRHITKIAPSLKYCGSFSESQPREIIYEIREEAEPDKNYKEENAMTNAEMAKQIKEFSEKLDRYFANQEATIGKYDGEIKQLNDKLEELAERVNGLGIVAQETTRQLKEQTDRLNRYRDVQDKQFATYDSKIEQLETSSKLLRVTISGSYGIPEEAKTIESIYPCLWACVHRGKECNGLAQECPLAEHFSKEHGGGSWKNGVWTDPDGNEWAFGNTKSAEDKAKTLAPLWTDDAAEKMARPILFGKFNAGKMAIVFDGSDPHFEAAYMDFCRAFDEWCRTREKEDKLYPQSKWTTREKRMNPLMKCPSIYEDRSSFAIWVEHNEEEGEHTFEYGTLMTDWREHKTVGGLPYTVWKI